MCCKNIHLIFRPTDSLKVWPFTTSLMSSVCPPVTDDGYTVAKQWEIGCILLLITNDES